VSDEEYGKQATPEERAAFAKFLAVISTEDGREDFAESPVKALGQQHLANLPGDLRQFLEALSVAELLLLHRTCKQTLAAGLFSEQGGITFCHL
jgi:hypothetical protein